MKANFYTENRKFHLERLQLEPVVRHLENNFTGTGPDDLRNYDEARAWQGMVLQNAGDLCANFIAPRAQAVDEKGATFANGQVTWAPETQENMKALAQAGLMGGTLPRKYGGLNLPVTVNTVIVEMVSQADASLMNLFGLQDIAVTVSKFGTEEQKAKVLPRFARGEVSGSMALTEPDAGSDLQAVALKAIEKDGKWYLDGVKRFITNGCGEVSLVLAKSEPDAKGGRSLSMFLYERDEKMIIRRIEEKLGIHGSPTCELQFNMAPAELVGKRKFGLIKYVMSLMDGARMAVSAQALGIAQAAYDEALRYAGDREQFGKPIANIPAVYQMLRMMEAEIETSRALLYRAALSVDMTEHFEARAEHGEDVKNELKAASTLASFLTPLTKFTLTEMCNKVAYDALQVHGGVGYMKDFAVERLYRDARITNIYEGTTQLQAVAAMGGITTGLLKQFLAELEALQLPTLGGARQRILHLAHEFEQTVELARAVPNKDFLDYVANYLVEMGSLLLRNILFIEVAEGRADKRPLFELFHMESTIRLKTLTERVRQLHATYGERISDLAKPLTSIATPTA
jgi:alkylation response protein AidB-like acyl-CoA dehydrogenase